MFATRESRRRGITYAILVALTLLLLAVSRSAPMVELRRGIGFALAPIQGALTEGTHTFTSLFGTLGQIQDLRADNARLEERIQVLEVENRRVEGIRIQNDQLTQLLGVRSSFQYGTVAAEVIGRGIIENERIVTLSQGADAGVSEGDVVIAGGAALVGRVYEVGRNFSRVRLISDTRSVVIGLVESSRATGEVAGRLSGSLVMSKIPSTDTVKVGETVVTAGIELGNGVRSPFPKGLLIGQIIDVNADPTNVVQTASVLPAAPLDKLEYVLIVTGYDVGGEGPTTSPGPPTPPASGAPTPPASGRLGTPGVSPSGTAPRPGASGDRPSGTPTLPPAP